MSDRRSIKFGRSLMIGVTILGREFPVFFDPHFPILNDKSPMTLITGSPGSGKTFFGLTLATHASILNKDSIIFDPKGDFRSLKTMEKLGAVNKINFWSLIERKEKSEEDGSDVSISSENIGILDTTTFFSDTNRNAALTIDVIKGILGEMTPTQESNLTPIVSDVVEDSNPSFNKIINALLSNRNDEIRNVGFALKTFMGVPLAKLLSRDKRSKPKMIDFSNATTVVDLSGLRLPTEGKNKNEYNTDEKVSVVIMGLLSTLVLEQMKEVPKSVFKALFIDEAWAVMASPAGASMIQETGRLGRSLNMATILMTQSPTDIEGRDDVKLSNSITCRFAFRNNSRSDNEITCNSMGLPHDENMPVVLSDGLQKGQCLMQDSFKEVSIVEIMVQDKWAEAFNTNPTAEIFKKK